MVELIIEESGFPKDRPTLKLFQDSFKSPIDGVFKHFAGNRILAGFEETDNGDGTLTISEGLLLFRGKVYTFSEFTGAAVPPFLYFYANTGQFSFNVGTEAVPVYENRDAYITRTATDTSGGAGYIGKLFTNQLLKERRFLEYYKSGTTVLGNIIQRTDQPIYDVMFDEIPTSDYLVIGNFRPVDPAESFTAAFSWETKNKSNVGFDLVFNQVRAETPANIPVFFDWTLIATTRF